MLLWCLQEHLLDDNDLGASDAKINHNNIYAHRRLDIRINILINCCNQFIIQEYGEIDFLGLLLKQN